MHIAQILNGVTSTAIAVINLLGVIFMNKKLLQKIEELFTQKLQSKSGWGRNEIIQLYKDAVNEALLELLDS